MLTKEEIKQWLLENCVDEDGDLDLSYLDFSDFGGNVHLMGMKVKKTLFQDCQEVEGWLYQSGQKVKGTLVQRDQKVAKDLFQGQQEVGGELWQEEQKVGGSLYQGDQKVGKDLHQCSLEVKGKTFRDAPDPYVLLNALRACQGLVRWNLELLIAKAKAEVDFKQDTIYAEFESECSYRQGRETAFKEAEGMAERTARAIERWIGFAKAKEQKP